MPRPPSSFVGRTREINELEVLFETSRLVTLTGAGGSGKTRLALELVDTLRHRFRDGAYFVDLAPLSDPELVPSTIASALSIREEPGQPILDRIIERLGVRRVLVLLDNLEQLPAASPLIGELLARCPNIHVLVTSRAPLHLRGEQEYLVDPLRLPEPGELTSTEAVERSEAITLFLDRAKAVKPKFALTAANAATIADICRRLDGLPLAIELAAPRLRVLSPTALLVRLEHRLQLLSGGPSDAPSRQRTLRDTIGWSYELLAADEQRVLICLSIFAGGFTLPVAEAVVREPSEPSSTDFLESLSHLVDQNLLRVTPGAEGEPRFSMLETIREFASERLTASSQAEVIERRFVEAYLAVVEQAAPELLGAHQKVWLDRLEGEVGNIRAALAWAIKEGETVTAGRIGVALWRFWQLRGHLDEGGVWLDRILALPRWYDHPRERAMALEAAGGLAYWHGRFPAAEVHYTQALELQRSLGEPAAIATALYNLAFVYFLPKTDLPRARSMLEESLATFEALSDRTGMGKVYWALSSVIYVESDDVKQDDLERAAQYNEMSQTIFRESNDAFSLGWALHWRGLIAMRSGDLVTARSYLGEGLRLFADATDVSGITFLLDDFSALAVAEGDVQRAACLSGAAAALESSSGTDLAGFLSSLYSRPRPEGAQLAKDVVATAWAKGYALSAQEAVVFALRVSTDAVGEEPDFTAFQRAAPKAGGRHDLTVREREVLQLLAAGRSDGEIAEVLFISKKTASVHVANIKGKLGANSRIETAMIAQRLGLVASRL